LPKKSLPGKGVLIDEVIDGKFIRMVVKDMLYGDVDSAYLAQCRVQLLIVVNTVMKFKCPSKSKEFVGQLLDY
jgi:hypothetical protein